MPLHLLNCFTCSARAPSSWHTGTLCILAETNDGLVLIDTGPGLADYRQPPPILRLFRIITKVPLDPDEASSRQVVRLGFKLEDVRHVVLTHMHFDHCGGLGDFPQATVHVHRLEHEAFLGGPRHFTDLAYVRHHLAHKPSLALYEDRGEHWKGLPAIRLPFEPEMWLIPLHGHTRGHCGVAMDTGAGWHFHVGDAGPVALEDYAPAWLVNFVMGPHTDRLREFSRRHPEVHITTGHMWLEFFDALRSKVDSPVPRDKVPRPPTG
jgi:glyoxylase-like metal-dependent hydrolase (beta-lactamase superfamily II)